MSTPEILPPDRQLDKLAEPDMSDIHQLLMESHEEAGTFTDIDFEANSYPELFQYIEHLSRILSVQGENSDEAFKTAYEAFCFAYTASNVMTPGKVSVAVGDYLNSVQDDATSEEQLCQRFLGDAQDYLQHREYIDGLIGGVMAEVDISGRNLMVAETVAALTFMQIENGERKLYIDQQVDDFTSQMEDFLEPDDSQDQ